MRKGHLLSLFAIVFSRPAGCRREGGTLWSRIQPRPQRGKAVRTILEWTEEIVLAVVLIAVVFTFVCRVVTVTGTSMVPSFHEGDRVLVVNDFNGVEQGDVVVIVNVLEEPIIKRVIATEGQTVDFDYEAGVVYVDGQPVDETQFGLENGITSEPFSSFELLEFPRPCPRAACLSWGQPGCLRGQPLPGRGHD